MIDLERLIQDAHHVPPLPTTVTKVISLMQGDDWSVDAAVEVIRVDAGLTARMLRLANSVAYGRSGRSGNLREAVLRIGRSAVLSTSIAAGARSALPAKSLPAGYGEREFWRHSVASTLAVEKLERTLGISVAPEAATAALLHEVGQFLLGHLLSPDILSVLGRACEEGHLVPWRAESEVLKVNHAEVGALIAQHWNLPDLVVSGILHHHEPSQGEGNVAALVHVADEVARVAEGEISVEVAYSNLDPSAREQLKLTVAQFEKVCAAVVPDLENVISAYD